LLFFLHGTSLYLPRLYPCALVVKKSAGLQIFVAFMAPQRAANQGGFAAKINPKISDTIALRLLQTLYSKYYYLLCFIHPLKIR
jgi:hypothetical protein